MKNLYIALCAICLASVTLTGCASGPDTRTPLDRVEFGPDECGTAEISGTVDVNGNPFITTNVHIKVDKQKPCAPAE